MLLGIDVGGTFTDAVVVSEGVIRAQAKSPTTPDVLTGILAVLDLVLAEIPTEQIERVALSTTVVTNALIQGRVSAVGLLVIPGPGLDCAALFPTQPILLDGYIDHRGCEAAPINKEQVKEACQKLSRCEAIAISGKFSVRNPQQETQVADWVAEFMPGCSIIRGAEVSGGLNFLRRTNSAYYNAAVGSRFRFFATAAAEAVRLRNIEAPIYILKADGGTLPLSMAERYPVETVFTGPAASVLGILAMARPQGQAVSLDIGGTTTDIALWQNGNPLSAPRGVKIAGYDSAVRSFRLRSIGVGGDSVVRQSEGAFTVGPERIDPTAVVGGLTPTLSDALIVTGGVQFGDIAKSRQALGQLLLQGQTTEEAGAQIIAVAVERITREIQTMLEEYDADPVYRVEDILAREPLVPDHLIFVGGAGAGLAPHITAAWSEVVNRPCTYHTPVYASIANAVGAAIARPTLTMTIRADTEQGYFSVPELAIHQPLERRHGTVEGVRCLAEQYLLHQAATLGIDATSLETVLTEEFNLVRDFRTIGKNIYMQIQVTPGVLTTVDGKEEGL